MTTDRLGRRGFLGGTAAVALGAGAVRATAADTEDAFVYQVRRSDTEWRAMLNDQEFSVLREGGTEEPHSNSLWNEKRPGIYCCRGCDLAIYKSLYKLQLNRGWAFFRHSMMNTVLTELDLRGGRMGDPFAELLAGMEVHCRRCGSHLGHIVVVSEKPEAPIHCINGTSLRFEVAEN